MVEIDLKCHVFSGRNTNAMIVCTWTVSLSLIILINLYVDCSFMYNILLYTFTFVANKNGTCFARDVYSTKDLSILAITSLVDFATIVAVRRTAKAAKNMSREVYAKRLKELNLLKQAVAQAAIFAAQILCVAFLARRFDNKWMKWSLTAVAWNVLHLVDPLIIIAFNKDFRKLLRPTKVQPPKSTAFQSAIFHSRQTATF
ncbi:unnamed protein product [Cylicocyclus nassatus]|uniref:7TM GPCR serpentine receptor class x (Srx) domain-containing protein n=1 Tax=Cylicocyclus nassatus TaxID=53992 RepID=A0AA36DKH5_CYLNA|nr:unnamed protein product [Cylicocyclus nassatus]